jgi:hypothetical protein
MRHRPRAAHVIVQAWWRTCVAVHARILQCGMCGCTVSEKKKIKKDKDGHTTWW